MAALQLAQDLVTTLLMMGTTAVWPPTTTGAFWITVGVFAVVSIFFDDETPRGNPGINYSLSASHSLAER